jgi:hypothetical protein
MKNDKLRFKTVQECLVLDLLHQPAVPLELDKTSAMINDKLIEGWKLFSAFPLNKTKEGREIIVFLVRNRKYCTNTVEGVPSQYKDNDSTGDEITEKFSRKFIMPDHRIRRKHQNDRR